MTNHFDPNDLRHPREADAPSIEEDADALDALLEEITTSQGRPITPPGGRNDRDRHSANESLASSARGFHRRYRAAEARSGEANALDPTLWEQIMATTAPSSMASDVSTAPARPGARASSRRPSGWLPSRTWSAFGNATLALLIIFAAFATWRVFDRVSGGSDDPPPVGTVQGLAQQPDATASTGTEVPPVVATPTPAYACDFSRDIPIFQQVDESPIDGTALLLTTDGDLLLDCPEEPEPVVLAMGLGSVGPGFYPGIVTTYQSGSEDNIPGVTYINIMTGKHVTTGMREDAIQYFTETDSGSPWLVAPDQLNPNTWTITDLRTMESRNLNSFPLAGASIPSETSIISATDDNGTLVVGLMSRTTESGNGSLLDVDGGGVLLVVDGSIDDAHWIGVPGDLTNTRQILLSPTGKAVALKSTDGETSIDGQITYTMLRTSDGAELTRSDQFEDWESQMRWVQDGSTLAYTQGSRVVALEAKVGSSPVTVFEGPDQLGGLRTTHDPDTVVVTRRQAEEVATETPERVQPIIYSVNIATGKVIEIEGVDVSQVFSEWWASDRFLVISDTGIERIEEDVVSFRVLDSATGQQVGELTQVRLPRVFRGDFRQGLGPDSMVTTWNGAVEVIGFSPAEIRVLQLVNGQVEIRHLPAPGGNTEAIDGMVSLWMSPDGAQVSATFEGDEAQIRYLIDLTDPESEWLEVPTAVGAEGSSLIFFVPGTGD